MARSRQVDPASPPRASARECSAARIGIDLESCGASTALGRTGTMIPLFREARPAGGKGGCAAATTAARPR